MAEMWWAMYNHQCSTKHLQTTVRLAEKVKQKRYSSVTEPVSKALDGGGDIAITNTSTEPEFCAEVYLVVDGDGLVVLPHPPPRRGWDIAGRC